MDLIAGDAREILLALAIDDRDGLRDPGRFEACLSLGGSLDPTWLDLFARAVRECGDGVAPAPFTAGSYPIGGVLPSLSGLVLERVDPEWIGCVASLSGPAIDRAAARWVELIDLEERPVDPDDKPMLRELAGDLVAFCRRARAAEDVLLAWSIQAWVAVEPGCGRRWRAPDRVGRMAASPGRSSGGELSSRGEPRPVRPAPRSAPRARRCSSSGGRTPPAPRRPCALWHR
jgi:hypothetical protein